MTLEAGKSYIMARSARNRPTLQHRLAFQYNGDVTTLCGQDTSAWSKAYFAKAIDQLICRRCVRLGG